MKKFFALLMVLVMCFSFAACSNGGDASENSEAVSEKTENIAEDYITETAMHIYKDVKENQAKAMQNTYLFEVSVGDITDKYFDGGNDSVTIGGTTYLAANNVRVYLPTEDLAKLKKGENVAIVGRITEVINGNIAYGNQTYIVFGEAQIFDGTVAEVAPRDDEIFTGVLKGKNEGYPGYWNIQMGDSNVLTMIAFAEGEDLSSYNEEYSGTGEEITFTAYMLGGAYHDAKIIS